MPLVLNLWQAASAWLHIAAIILIISTLAIMNFLDSTDDYFGSPLPDHTTLILMGLFIYSHMRAVMDTRPHWSISRPCGTLKFIVASLPTVYITSTAWRWSSCLDLYLLAENLVPTTYPSVRALGIFAAMFWHNSAALYAASCEAVAEMHDSLHPYDYSDSADDDTFDTDGECPSTRPERPLPFVCLPHAESLPSKISPMKSAAPTSDSVPSVTPHSFKEGYDSSQKATTAPDVAEKPTPVTGRDTTPLPGLKTPPTSTTPKTPLQRPSPPHTGPSHANIKQESDRSTQKPYNAAKQSQAVPVTHSSRDPKSSGTTAATAEPSRRRVLQTKLPEKPVFAQPKPNVDPKSSSSAAESPKLPEKPASVEPKTNVDPKSNGSAAEPPKRRVLQTKLPEKPVFRQRKPSVDPKRSDRASRRQSTTDRPTCHGVAPRPGLSKSEDDNDKPTFEAQKAPDSKQQRPTAEVPQSAEPSVKPVAADAEASTAKTTSSHAKPSADSRLYTEPSRKSPETEQKASATSPTIKEGLTGSEQLLPKSSRPELSTFAESIDEVKRAAQPAHPPQPSVRAAETSARRVASAAQPRPVSDVPATSPSKPATSTEQRGPRESEITDQTSIPSPPGSSEGLGEGGDIWREFWDEEITKLSHSAEQRDEGKSSATEENSAKTQPQSTEHGGERPNRFAKVVAEMRARQRAENQKSASTKTAQSGSNQRKSTDVKQETHTPKPAPKASTETHATDEVPKAETANASNSSNTSVSSSRRASANLDEPFDFDWTYFAEEAWQSSPSSNRSRSGSSRSSGSNRTSSSRGPTSSTNTTPGSTPRSTPGSSKPSPFHRYNHQPWSHRPPRPARKSSSKSTRPSTTPPKPQPEAQPRPQPRPHARPQTEEDQAYTSKAGYNQKFHGNYKAYNPFDNSPPPQSGTFSGSSHRDSWGQRPHGDPYSYSNTNSSQGYTSYAYSNGSPGGQQNHSSYSSHSYYPKPQQDRHYSSNSSDWENAFGSSGYQEQPHSRPQSSNNGYTNWQQRRTYQPQDTPPRQAPPPPPPPPPPATEPAFNPYTVLNIPRTATAAEVRKTYKKASINAHPDKAVQRGVPKEEADAEMKDLNRAKAILCDNVARCVYHRYGLQHAESESFLESQRARFEKTKEEEFEEKFRGGVW